MVVTHFAMESPFNKGFGPGHQSPAYVPGLSPTALLTLIFAAILRLSHAPPAGSAYQVNVNRTKTRKWVEARVQSYDGDDWGADEYSDDDGPEPEPSVQQSSSQIPAAGTDVASPPIHHPTQGPHPPSVASLEASEPSTTKKPAERDKTVSSQFTGAHSSSRLVESDGPSVGSLGARSNPPHADRGGDGGGRDSASPQLPDVARMSSFGVDLFTPASGFAVEPMIPEHNRYDLPLSSQPPRAMEKNQYQVSALESGPSLSSPLAQKTPPGMHKKLPSASHSLKEVNSGKPSTNAKSLSENTIEEPLAEIAFTNSDDTGREPDYVPSRSTADAILAHPQARQPALHLESGWPTIPPLRTPSPRASAGDLAGQGGMFNVTDSKPSEASDAFQYKQHDHELEPISLQRQLTASTIVSSPGKDNDILSDEILRSLSSGGSSSADPSTGDGRKSFLALNPSVARNSSYTLQDYDSYWADTSDKAPTALPRATALESKSMVVSSSETPGPDEHARVGDVDSRKRFSWEAEEGRTNSPSPNPPYLSSTTDELAAVPLARAEQGPTPPPNGVGDGPSSAEAESPMSADTASGSVAGSDGGQEPLQMPQPPSPPTVSSDRQASVGRDCEILSCPDEGARAPDSSSVFSPTPPPEFQTSLADQPPSEAAELQGPQHPAAHAPSMTFREILGLPARAERIARYNETRNYFASADTGLNAWLTSLQAQNPEYANGPESLARTTSYPLAQAESHPSSANAQPPAAQQPYYQQYLNATAPSTSSASRSRPGGPPMPSQSTGSAFGHPSHQIGFKSKEFMHSAGKMGKGLLSKGKNKLRGSGDKVFH